MKLFKLLPLETGFSALRLLLLFVENILLTTSSQGFVALPPSILNGPEPKDVYFRTIGSTKFNCFAWGHPFPTITWLKNGQLLNVNHGGISITDYGQTVTLNSDDDGTASYMEGDYQCLVENQYGKLVSNTTRYIKALSKRTGDDSKQTLNITIGEKLRLDYKGNILNRPKGSIGWKAAEKDIFLDQRIQMDDRGSLYFAYTLLEDKRGGQMYKSETHNIPLDSFIGSSYYQVNIMGTEDDLRGIKPELAFSSPSHVVGLEGQNLTLKCFYYGYPQPEIDFIKMGKPLPIGRDHFIKPSTLVISNASVDDAGTYRCTGRNTYGVDSQSIEVTIEAAPRVMSHENVPSNRNVTEGEDVIFKCLAYGYPPPSYQWIIDGQPLLPQQIPPRKVSLSKDGKLLTMRNVCKRCEDGVHDMKVVQCNVTNKHGYLLLSGYLNILEKTRAQITGYKTEETVLDEEDRALTYQCTATGDPSTNITKQWLRMISTPSYSILFGSYYEKEEYEILSKEPPYVEIDSFGMLKLVRRKRDSKRWSQIGHKFKCFVTNGYSSDEKLVVLNIPDSPLASRLGILNWWWLFVLFALFLMLIIALVVCCRKILKQKGSEYDVDAREKLNGNEPEKELVNHGFKAYRRPDDMAYLKGSRASLGSSGHCSDEEGSLSDYGLVDGGKFNEDGSFVGAYVTNPKPGQMKVRREYISSPLTRYYT